MEIIANYGRESAVDDIKRTVDSGHHVVVFGPSGIGKSTVARALNRALAFDQSMNVFYRVAGSYDSVDSIVNSIAAQLLAQLPNTTVDPGEIGRSLANAGRNHITALAAAALMDITKAVAPGVGKVSDQIIASVRSEMEKSVPRSQVEALLASAKSDALAGVLTLLSALANNGVSGSITLDQVEEASSTVHGFIEGLSREAPPGWSLILTINDEIPNGITWIKDHWPSLAYAGAQSFTVHPMSRVAAEAWYRSSWGRNPDPVELAAVLAWCEGRPLLMRDWIEGRVEFTKMRDAWIRVGPYYQARLATLKSEARNLLQTLALIPGRVQFSFAFMQQLFPGELASRVNETIVELVDAGFLVPSFDTDTWEFKHDVILLQARRNVPGPVAKEFARAAIAAVETAMPNSESRGFIIARLALLTDDTREAAMSAIGCGPSLLATGSFESLEGIARDALGLNPEPEVSDALLLLLARALHGLGRYDEALQEIARVSQDSPASNLMAGQILVRQSKYADADERLQAAMSGFATGHDFDGLRLAAREVNVILRDIGEYKEAASIARRLLCGLDEYRDRILASSLHRTAARSLALMGMWASTRHAQRAIDLAGSSLSHVGNGHLAMGEALRHCGKHVEAIAEYRKAAEIANLTGNRDSFLWSRLGEGDCLLLSGDAVECIRSIQETLTWLAADPAKHPLEYMHYAFLHQVADFVSRGGEADDVRRAAQRYADLPITWPLDYTERLVELRRAPIPMRF